jgi:hypothetical protein
MTHRGRSRLGQAMRLALLLAFLGPPEKRCRGSGSRTKGPLLSDGERFAVNATSRIIIK